MERTLSAFGHAQEPKLGMASQAMLIVVVLTLLGGITDTPLAQRQVYVFVPFILYSIVISGHKSFVLRGKTMFFWGVFLALLVWLCVGLLLSLEIVLTLRYILFFIAYLLVAYFYLSIPTYSYFIKQIRILSIVLAISIILSALMRESFVRLFSFWILNQKRVLLDMRSGQFSGLIGNRAFAAYAMSTALSAWFAHALSAKKKMRSSFLPIGLCLIALMLTGKRIMLLMTIVPVGVCWMVSTDNRIRRRVAGILTAAFAIGILALAFVAQSNVILDRILGGLGDTTFNGRTKMWALAWQLFLEHPIVGSGIASYLQYNQDFGLGTHQFAHNQYLQLMAETGLVGTILFLLFFVQSIRLAVLAVRQSGPARDGSATSIALFALMTNLASLIYGLTGYPLYNLQNGVLYAISLGMSFCVLSSQDSLMVRKRSIAGTISSDVN